MPRRVTLPGADELFRATTLAESAPGDDAATMGRWESSMAAEAASAPSVPMGEMSAGPRRPTGRTRHADKITVYVSPDELVELERCRLMLRATHGLGIDRGRIVREALSVVLADFDAKGADSILVRRLRG